jgi:hypothetical protein
MDYWSANPGAYPYRIEALQQATKDWFDTSNWRSITDVTLSLKHSYHGRNGTAWLNQTWAEKNFAYFMRRLNRKAYGNANRCYGKQLRVFGVLEKSQFGRFNIHAAIEPPRHLEHEEFEALITGCWAGTDWGYDEIKVRPGANSGWIDYMLKYRQKDGLEHWSDCILGTFYNPTVDF